MAVFRRLCSTAVWGLLSAALPDDRAEAVDIVLINRPELPPAGAGESSIRPVAAALANAVFDATGVRLRRAPLTPERLKSGSHPARSAAALTMAMSRGSFR